MKIVVPRSPLDGLTPTPSQATARVPLARRDATGPLFSPSRPKLGVEADLERFEGRIRQADQRLYNNDSHSIVQTLRSSIILTRPEWSEDNAATLEKQLATQPTSPVFPDKTEILAQIGAKIAAAAFENRVDTILDFFRDDPNLGVPLGFAGAFAEAVVNETGKEKIAEVFREYMKDWLSRTRDFAATISGLRERLSEMFRNTAGLVNGERLASVRTRLAQYDSSFSIARSTDLDVSQFNGKSFQVYWLGFSKTWAGAAQHLPKDMQRPANDLLTRIKAQLDALDRNPPPRAALRLAGGAMSLHS